MQERVLDAIRGLLAELRGIGTLAVVSPHAHLDSELGLGSLERVELLARLEAEFAVRLPDTAVAEANSAEELVNALMRGASATSTGHSVTGSCPAFAAPQNAAERTGIARQTFSECGVETAQTLLDVLHFRGRNDAARSHLMITPDEGASSTLTFGELYAGAQGVAAELARRGVNAGDTVALMLPTSKDFFLTFVGILMAGAIPVPIYPPVRVDRIEEYAARQAAILQNAEAKLLVTFRRAQAVAQLLKPRVTSLSGVVDAAQLIAVGTKSQPPVVPQNFAGSRARRATDIALLQYTSGSTGEPKGVVLTHANLLANIRAIGKALQVRPSDAGVSWLPLYHDMGLIGAWLMPLYFGLQLAVMSPLAFLTRPERWLWAVHQHRGTLAAAPNFAYELCTRRIAEREIEGLDLSSWRAALNGAEPVNPETVERFCKRFAKYGFRREAMLPVYGLAEAALAVTMPRMDRGPLVDRIFRQTFTGEGSAVPIRNSSAPVEAGTSSQSSSDDMHKDLPNDASAISFVSCGVPLPDHEVRIVDGGGHEVSERVEGYLWFRGPSATSGYYRNDAASKKLFPQGRSSESSAGEGAWINSGDRAYQAEGEIYITGRVKDIIIKAGRNLYPHEIEEIAGRSEGVRKGCVVAFGDTDASVGTERMVIVAESRETEAVRREQIARAITEEVSAALGLPPDQVKIVLPGSIPKTSSGKLRRDETKRLYETGKLGVGKPPVWLQIARLGASGVLSTGKQRARQATKRIVEGAYGVYAIAVFAVGLLLAWAIVILLPTRRASCRFTSATLKLLFVLVGCRVRVIGRKFLEPTQAQVLVANHASYCDVLALMAALGVDYRFVSKLEVRGIPFIGTFLRKMGHYAFDRSDPRARVRQAQEIEETLRRGESVFVFPEGTFTRYEGLRAFQLGAFKAAVAVGCPVCPVALRGTRQLLRDESFLPRPSDVVITISPPIKSSRQGATSGSAAEEQSEWRAIVRLRDAAREAISRNCGEPLL